MQCTNKPKRTELTDPSPVVQRIVPKCTNVKGFASKVATVGTRTVDLPVPECAKDIQGILPRNAEELVVIPLNGEVRCDLQGRSRGSLRWSEIERGRLLTLVSNHPRHASGNIPWDVIHSAWALLAGNGEVNHRTKSSLSSFWHSAKSTAEVLRPAALRAGATSGASIPPGTAGICQRRSQTDVGRHAALCAVALPGASISPETAEINQEADSLRPDQIVEQAMNFRPDQIVEQAIEVNVESIVDGDNEELAFLRLCKKFHRSLAKGTKKSKKHERIIPRKPAKFDVQKYTALGDRFLLSVLGEAADISEVSDAVFAVAMAVNETSRKAVRAIRAPAVTQEANWESEIKWTRKLMSWVSQELYRRQTKRWPTGKQRYILSELKKLTKVNSRSLREYYTRCSEQLLITKHLLQRKQEETRRQLAKKRKLGCCFVSTGTGAEGDPSAGEFLDYWTRIVGKAKRFRTTGVLRRWESSQRHAELDPHMSLVKETFNRVVSKTRPWKAPGPDGVHNFWWKHLKVARARLLDWVAQTIDSADELPDRVAEGRMIMLPKSSESKTPADFRPIACLNTSLKVLTAVMAKLVYGARSKSLPLEQVALRPKIWGVTHAHFMDSALLLDQQKRTPSEPISVAWIDFSKAFDSLPHSYVAWLIRSLRLGKIGEIYLDFLSKVRVRFEASVNGKRQVSKLLRVLSGVPQGDAFSPLMFCLSVAPISFALNTANVKDGYVADFGNPDVGRLDFNHLMYVDDLKLYGSTASSLYRMIRTVRRTAKSIGLTLNPGKCAEWHSGSGTENAGFPLLESDRQYYKYLGVEQLNLAKGEIAMNRVFSKIVGDFSDAIKPGTSLSQIRSLINTVLMPRVRFLCGCLLAGTADGLKLNSQLKRARTLDLELRKVLESKKLRYSKANVDRIYMTGAQGSGIMSAVDVCEVAILSSFAYLALQPQLETVYYLFKKYSNKGKRTVVKDAMSIVQDIGVGLERDTRGCVPKLLINGKEFFFPTDAARALSRLLVTYRESERSNAFAGRSTAGRVLSDPNIDQHLSTLWLKKGFVNLGCWRNITASQEAQLTSRGHPLNRRAAHGGKCRFCSNTETAEHILTQCPMFRPTLMLERHNDAARNILFTILEHYGLESLHYTQTIKETYENDRAKVWWDKPILTLGRLKHYRPDIVVFDFRESKICVVEVGVSWYDRLKRTTERKFAKYAINSMLDESEPLPWAPAKCLAMEMQRLYKMTVHTVPVIIGATGEVLPDIKDQLLRLPGFNRSNILRCIERLQRSTVLGSDRIIRSHLASAATLNE